MELVEPSTVILALQIGLEGLEQLLNARKSAVELGELAVELLSGMTNLNPRARWNIERVLAHPYWLEGGD